MEVCLQMCNSFSSWEIWSEKLLTDNAARYTNPGYILLVVIVISICKCS